MPGKLQNTFCHSVYAKKIDVAVTASVVHPKNYQAKNNTLTTKELKPSLPSLPEAKYTKTRFPLLGFGVFLGILFLVLWKVFYELYPILFKKPTKKR